jgi:hypothetical protein
VTNPVYLDTSAVVRFGLSLAGSPEQRDIDGCKAFEQLLKSDARVAASPVTLAEYCSVLHTHLRREDGWLQGFGEQQVDLAEGELMGLIAKNRVRIRPLGSRAFEIGMSYVSAASREHSLSFKAWDAIHLYEAGRWAREINERVIVATADTDFQKFIDVFPGFAVHISLLDTTASSSASS